MTIFDYIKDITTYKKGNLFLDEYIPFLVSRWLSFISPQACIGINESVNMLGNVAKEQHYKLLLKLFPKTKVQFIKYIKKIKEEKSKENEQIAVWASNMEVSKREIELLLELEQQLT